MAPTFPERLDARRLVLRGTPLTLRASSLFVDDGHWDFLCQGPLSMVERVRVVVHRDKNSVPPAYFDEYSEGDYCDEEDSEEDNEISAEDYYIDAIDKAETLLALIRDRVSKLPSVQRLELPWFDSSSDILSSITPLTRLSSLHLISEDATQAVSLDALCDAPAGQRGLRHLRVTTFRDVHVSPSGIAAIATLQNLESLSLGPERNPALRCCGRLPRGHLEEIAKLQGLTSLELLYGRGHDVSPIASLTNLRRLVMSDYTETCTRAVASWSSLSRLTHLSLTQCGDDIETGLVCLSEMQELQEFTLIACRGATGAFMAHLPRSLKRLHVRAALWYDDKWGGYLAHLKQLESLSLEACEDIHARTQNALRGLSRLRELRMPYSWVGRHCPCFLETLTGLEVLDLTGCPYVTQRAVNHIKALTKLRELSLAHCGTRSTHLKDEAISTIVRLDSLERLALCEAEVTDKGLRKLLQLPRLDALLLRFCQKITKKAVTMLSSHGSLRVLDMRKCPRVRSPPAVEKSAEALLDSMCYICKTGWRGAPNNEYACDLMELGQDWTQGLPRERVTRRAAELTTWVDMLDRKGLLWVLEQFSSR